MLSRDLLEHNKLEILWFFSWILQWGGLILVKRSSFRLFTLICWGSTTDLAHCHGTCPACLR